MPYNRNIYNLDPERFAHMMVPVKWRLKGLMAWIKALSATWADLWNRFQLFRTQVKYNLLITPQVCFLERALNDKYDPVQRRIFIADGSENDPVFLYMRAELKPVNLFKRSEDLPVYMVKRTETAVFGVDFTVNVPLAIVFDQNEMRTYVSIYKLATKNFSIEIF
jgi:hypothetical protein